MRIPEVPDEQRLQALELSCGFYQITARYGYMESPDIPALLAGTGLLEPPTAQPSYYLGRETVVPTGRAGFTRMRKQLFTFLNSNARPVTAYFGLPPNRVIELGAQIEI